MVILKSLFLAGLLLSSAFAQSSTNKPLMATLQVQSNYDFSLTYKEFRVHYSGVGFETTEPVNIKIFKKIPDAPSKEVHTFIVDELKKNVKKAYYFALDDVEDGEYEVEVCVSSTCSGKTSALTEISSKEQKKLTCEKGSKDTTGQYEIWTPAGEFSLDFNGPKMSDWITDPDNEFTEIEKDLNAAIRLLDSKSKINYKTDYKRLKLQANPTYEQKTFYAAIKYNISQYKELFDKYRGDGKEDRSEYAHDKCKRKYLLSAHTHLVNTETKEVKYRFKTTLHLSGAGKQYFILGQGADSRLVHVEMTHENVEIDEGTYAVHIIFCATEKDAIESTFCAPPVIYTGTNLMVYAREE